MPAKTKTTKSAPKGAETVLTAEDSIRPSKPGNQPIGPDPFTTRTGVDMLPADREVLNQSIDDRMAALLKDHQAMGVRPK